MNATRSAARKGSPAARAAGETMMLDVLRQFRIVIRSIKRHYQWVEKRCGVSGAQLWAMERVAASPGMSPSDLAAQLAIHPSTASNLLARLEELGMVRRSRRSPDQRRVQLAITPRGAAVLRKAPRPLKGVLQQALVDMSPAGLAALQRHLNDLLALMRVRDDAARTTLLSDI